MLLPLCLQATHPSLSSSPFLSLSLSPFCHVCPLRHFPGFGNSPVHHSHTHTHTHIPSPITSTHTHTHTPTRPPTLFPCYSSSFSPHTIILTNFGALRWPRVNVFAMRASAADGAIALASRTLHCGAARLWRGTPPSVTVLAVIIPSPLKAPTCIACCEGLMCPGAGWGLLEGKAISH